MVLLENVIKSPWVYMHVTFSGGKDKAHLGGHSLHISIACDKNMRARPDLRVASKSTFFFFW
jgi:hypothetical protein